MARTLEFDYPKAIEKAMRLFWKSGYAGTSLRELLRALLHLGDVDRRADRVLELRRLRHV